MPKKEDGLAAVGCALMAIYVVVALAWIGFLIWGGITLVNWLVTK